MTDYDKSSQKPSIRDENVWDVEASWINLANLVMRNRRMIAKLPFLVAVIVLVVAFGFPRTYTSWTAFVPQSPQVPMGGLVGLAEQFGVNLRGGDAGQSPAFYAELLRSREILETIVSAEYAFDGTEDTVEKTYLDLYKIKGEPETRRLESGVEHLSDRIIVQVGRETGIVRIGVKVRWPSVAHSIATTLVELVTEFDLNTRQSQAAAERVFVEERLEQERASLRAAEDEVEGFLETNREFLESPVLRFEHDRLQREVVRRQQIYTSLNQAYEQARIDEVRNTPVLTLVEQPSIPARPDRRGLALKGIMGMIFGVLLGVAVALGREAFSRNRADDVGKYEQFARLRQETLRDMLRPWRFIIRR